MSRKDSLRLLDAFEELNERKRWHPESMTPEDRERWTKMRRELESLLFNENPDSRLDNRQFLRVPVALEVRYLSQNELRDRYIQVLGEGGIFVSTVDPLPVGSLFDLEVVLARKSISVRLKGQVVWINRDPDPARRGMGVQFVDMTYEQKQIIYSLVDDSLRQNLLERRRFARVDTNLRVEFVYAEGLFEMQSADLGLGGLFIETEHLIPVGEKIQLILHIPGTRPAVKALGEVVRVVDDPKPGQPAGMGIHFLELDVKDQVALSLFLGMKVAGRVEAEQENPERRRSTRVRRRVKLRFSGVRTMGVVYSHDISGGGLFIQTHEPLPLHSAVKVTLVHPSSLAELDLIGKVVRVVGHDPNHPQKVPGIGIEFEWDHEEKRERLLAFLQEFAVAEIEDNPEQPGDARE